MVKIFNLTKSGDIPDFSFKNTKYWVDHDISHIKESFIWCLKKSLFILAAISILAIVGTINNSWNLSSILKFVFYTYISFFLTVWFIRVLFYKGYTIGTESGGFKTSIDLNISTVPHDFDKKN